MENSVERVCPVCGEKVVGRKDKVYCCDCCRSAAGNRRQRKMKEKRMKSRFMPVIEKDLCSLCGESGERYLKIKDDGDLNLSGICLVAGLGPENNTRRDGSFEYYISEPIVENDAKGGAPFILCYTEILRNKQG